jgi:hypothetical protein
MESTMPQDLEIALAPEVLDEGSPEEQAAFGLFTIRARHGSLTEGFDFFLNGYRPGPLVSGYHAAEWFAWNWWRLRWEPRLASRNWPFAHEMTTIGEGYLWPNITIFSDGLRTALISLRSRRPDAKPFRYVGALPLVVASTTFEAALDAFIPRVVGRLRDQKVGKTNLDQVWSDVLAERSEPEISKRRRLEALLGQDPGEADGDTIGGLLADATRFGEGAVEEVAAEAARGVAVLTADRLVEIAQDRGYDARPRDAVRLRPEHRVLKGADIPAWRVGADTARALREQEGLGVTPIDNTVLARLAGTQEVTISQPDTGDSPISFEISRNSQMTRIVLRSKWVAGRRFDLARLIGDRIISPAGALYPATRAYTYRQKAQRSFAAEFLSPFEKVDEMLGGDYSEERQQDIAEYFEVSPMTINTLLKNHGRIEREVSDFEHDVA